MNNFPSKIRAYTPICLCGQGAYGAVWLVTDATGVWLALKIVYKNSLGRDWQREFSGLEYYRNKVSEHRNLIRIHHIEDYGTFFYYTMDCADNLLPDAKKYCPATLANKIKQSGALQPEEVCKIFDQLLDGLEHLHESGVIHRDIKPDNIIFVNGIPKIGDIGLVSSVSHTLSLAGTQDFVPPEYLTGQEKEIRQSIDLYALGKTLYCAFSGQDPNQFPLLPPAILKNPSNRIFNKLAKGACITSPSSRIKTIPEFRSILHGNIGWGYEFQRVFSGLLMLLALPFILLLLAIRFLLTYKWILVILFLLILAWLGMVMKTYWRLEKELYPYDYSFHPTVLKRAFTEWEVEFGNYDLYDMEKKTKYSVKAHGERHLVTQREYLSAKHTYIPQNIGFEFEVDEGPASVKGKSQVTVEEPPLTQNTPLRENYLHELFFQGNYSPKLEVPAGTEWRDNRMLLPAVKKGIIRFTPELPLTSEVNLDFNPSKFNGTLEFVLTAAEYLPLPNKPLPEIQLKRQLRFKMNSDGKNLTFEEAIYRHQDHDEDNLMGFGKPKIKTISIQDKFYRLTIISADFVRRVYLNGNLIWGTHLAFFGGHFELKYSCKTSHVFSVKDFSVYDAKIVQPDEKRQSRLKLPVRQRLTEREEKLQKTKWLDAIFPKEFLPMQRILDDSCYGATNSSGSMIHKDRISLNSGKTFLIFHRNLEKPFIMNFSVVFFDNQTKIELQPYSITNEQGDKFSLGVINRTFEIHADAASLEKPQAIHFTLTCEIGSMTLTGKSGAKEVYNNSFFIPEANKFRYGFICDVKTKLNISVTDIIDSSVPEKYKQYLEEQKRLKAQQKIQEKPPIQSIKIQPKVSRPAVRKQRAKVKEKPPQKPFVPQRKSAKELSRRDYKDAQEDIAEYIGRRTKLKDIIPDYRNIPEEDVMIDTYYAHEKGGTVYEFIIPSKKIKGAIRLQHVGAFFYRELEEFYFNGKKIDPYQ